MGTVKQGLRLWILIASTLLLLQLVSSDGGSSSGGKSNHKLRRNLQMLPLLVNGRRVLGASDLAMVNATTPASPNIFDRAASDSAAGDTAYPAGAPDTLPAPSPSLATALSPSMAPQPISSLDYTTPPYMVTAPLPQQQTSTPPASSPEPFSAVDYPSPMPRASSPAQTAPSHANASQPDAVRSYRALSSANEFACAGSDSDLKNKLVFALCLLHIRHITQ